MKPRTPVVLFATLMSASAWGQEVSLYGTTMAQMWKQETPGFDKATFTPATQYLGIDATKLGTENLSLHLFGWGRVDLGSEASSLEGKSGGNLTYGYLQYRFDTANAEIKAGRFAINQGVGIEQVDGVSARADLRGGFTVSAFAGKPVLFKPVDPRDRFDYEFQRDFIFGSRLAWRMPKLGEIGLSYLQDGTEAAKDQDYPVRADFTRKQVGGDIRIAPTASFELLGRTVFDVASRPDTPAGQASPSRIAEHDYTVTLKLVDLVAVSGNYIERNFHAYYAGSNFRSLFRQDEQGKFSAWGGKLAVGDPAALQVVADFRLTSRETFGNAARYGADVRWSLDDSKLLAGAGYHKVDADDAVLVDGKIPTYSISHGEARAWVMYNGSLIFASLDGIYRSFDDDRNPYLNGRTSEYEAVASLGIQATKNLKISGDLSYGANPYYEKEVRGLLRAEFRFGMAR